MPSCLGNLAVNQVHQMDCLAGMRQLPDGCVDVAIIDPPYNASKGGDWTWRNDAPRPGFGGAWAKVMAAWDNLPLVDYVTFTCHWLREVQRLVRPTGSLWVHGTYHNSGIINFAMQLLRIEIINEVIWYKRNSFPNLSGRRLTASHETILWAHTGTRRMYYFDYDLACSLPCPEDPLRAPGKQMRTVWAIPNNKGRGELAFGRHPTQKPVRLLTRMLRLSARPGALVLAPFAGVGSECAAALRCGMAYLGFETDPGYADIANRRLAALAVERGPDAEREA